MPTKTLRGNNLTLLINHDEYEYKTVTKEIHGQKVKVKIYQKKAQVSPKTSD